MSSRSAAKKLTRPGKPARSSKPKAILAKGKPVKKPLGKVARFPKPKAKPHGRARPAPNKAAPRKTPAHKPAAKAAPRRTAAPGPPVPKSGLPKPAAPKAGPQKLPVPKGLPALTAAPQRPLLGLPPPGFLAARAASAAAAQPPHPGRTPQPPHPGRASQPPPARSPFSAPPVRSPLSQADRPLPGKTPMPPLPPKPGSLPPKKPLGLPQLRSGAVQTTPARQSLARSFYWSELRVGDDLPPLSKPPVDRVQIARYCAAANDFNRLHLDEPFAHALGFPGSFAPGALAMGFVGQLLASWLRRGHVRRISARFIKFVWPGDELTCRGRIAELRKENGACYADVELWAENRKGELVLRGQATCELYEAPGAASNEGAGFLFAVDHGHGASGAGRGTAAARPPQRPSSKPPPPRSQPPAPPKKK